MSIFDPPAPQDPQPSGGIFDKPQPPQSDDDFGSQAQAIGTGVIKGVPLGQTIASYGVPAVAAISRKLDDWGLLNEDQKKALSGLPTDPTAARATLRQKTEQSGEEHPYYQIGGQLLPGVVSGLGTTTKGAALMGAGSGWDEGDGVGDSIAHAALGAGTGVLGLKAAESVFPAAGFARQTILDSAKRLGVSMPRFSVGLPITQRAGMIAHSIPGASTPIEEATKESLEGLGSAAEGAAAGATPQTAGRSMSGALKDWIGPVSKGDVDAKYNAVAAAVNPRTKTPLSATLSVANNIAARRQAAGLDGFGGAVNHVRTALQRGDGLTYNGIKDLRTSVGEMLDSSILPADMSKTELNQIYGSLSTDLERAAYNAGGAQGVAAHQAATDFASQTAKRREQLTKLLGGPQAGASDEAVFGALNRISGKTSAGDIALLRQARQSVPAQSWDELSRGFVANMGRDGDGNFSPARFLTSYGKISDAAKDELFAKGSQLRQNLDDLHTVSTQWKSLGKYGNPSGTAGHGVGTAAAFRALRHPLEMLATVVGAKEFGKFLASPAGAGASANWVRAAGSRSVPYIRDAATRIASTAGAQLGANLDPLGLAALALHHYMPEAVESSDQGGGGTQPQ